MKKKNHNQVNSTDFGDLDELSILSEIDEETCVGGAMAGATSHLISEQPSAPTTEPFQHEATIPGEHTAQLGSALAESTTEEPPENSENSFGEAQQQSAAFETEVHTLDSSLSSYYEGHQSLSNLAMTSSSLDNMVDKALDHGSVPQTDVLAHLENELTKESSVVTNLSAETPGLITQSTTENATLNVNYDLTEKATGSIFAASYQIQGGPDIVSTSVASGTTIQDAQQAEIRTLTSDIEQQFDGADAAIRSQVDSIVTSEMASVYSQLTSTDTSSLVGHLNGLNKNESAFELNSAAGEHGIEIGFGDFTSEFSGTQSQQSNGQLLTDQGEQLIENRITSSIEGALREEDGYSAGTSGALPTEVTVHEAQQANLVGTGGTETLQTTQQQSTGTAYDRDQIHSLVDTIDDEVAQLVAPAAQGLAEQIVAADAQSTLHALESAQFGGTETVLSQSGAQQFIHQTEANIDAALHDAGGTQNIQWTTENNNTMAVQQEEPGLATGRRDDVTGGGATTVSTGGVTLESEARSIETGLNAFIETNSLSSSVPVNSAVIDTMVDKALAQSGGEASSSVLQGLEATLTQNQQGVQDAETKSNLTVTSSMTQTTTETETLGVNYMVSATSYESADYSVQNTWVEQGTTIQQAQNSQIQNITNAVEQQYAGYDSADRNEIATIVSNQLASVSAQMQTTDESQTGGPANLSYNEQQTEDAAMEGYNQPFGTQYQDRETQTSSGGLLTSAAIETVEQGLTQTIDTAMHLSAGDNPSVPINVTAIDGNQVSTMQLDTSQTTSQGTNHGVAQMHSLVTMLDQNVVSGLTSAEQATANKIIDTDAQATLDALQSNPLQDAQILSQEGKKEFISDVEQQISSSIGNPDGSVPTSWKPDSSDWQDQSSASQVMQSIYSDVDTYSDKHQAALGFSTSHLQTMVNDVIDQSQLPDGLLAESENYVVGTVEHTLNTEGLIHTDETIDQVANLTGLTRTGGETSTLINEVVPQGGFGQGGVETQSGIAITVDQNNQITQMTGQIEGEYTGLGADEQEKVDTIVTKQLSFVETQLESGNTSATTSTESFNTTTQTTYTTGQLLSTTGEQQVEEDITNLVDKALSVKETSADQ